MICRGSPIFIAMALGLPVVATDMAGGPSAQASAGPHSPQEIGYGTPVSAGLLRASNRGAGLLTTMAAGCLTRLVAAGSIRRRSTTTFTQATREGAFLPGSILLTRFIERRRLFSFAKTASSA